MGINASLLDMLNNDLELQETMDTFCRQLHHHTTTHTGAHAPLLSVTLGSSLSPTAVRSFLPPSQSTAGW